MSFTLQEPEKVEDAYADFRRSERPYERERDSYEYQRECDRFND